VAQVRCEGVDGLLVPVQADEVPTALVRPEVAVESGEEFSGLALKPVGKRSVVHASPGELCDAQLRVVDISLDLRRSNREERNAAVLELDAVPGILPALIAEALGRARCLRSHRRAARVHLLGCHPPRSSRPNRQPSHGRH